MIRRFPFIKTCENIYLNLKNYKPSNQRPKFHAVNHPFVSNLQLLDQTYFSWLTREVPNRVVQVLKSNNKSTSIKSTHTRNSIDQLNLTYLKRASPSIVKVITTTTTNDDNERDEQFKQLLDLCGSYTGLTSLIDKLPLISISTLQINQLIEEILRDLPSPSTTFHLSECLIEESKFTGMKNIKYINSEYYQPLYRKLDYINSICTIHKTSRYYDHQSPNQQFEEYLIWLGYHNNDLKSLETLIPTYLSSFASTLNQKVLSYFFSAFINNYEINYIKVLLQQLMMQKKGKTSTHNLEPILIETIIQQLIAINVMFEELILIFSIWLNNGGPLSIKLLSVLLSEYYKYGSIKEIDNFRHLINQVDQSSEDMYMIDLVDLKYKIINRQPSKFKKMIVKSDLNRFKIIKRSISNPEQLADFYDQTLKFSLKYIDDFNYINLILMNLKQDNMPISSTTLNLIATYYIEHQNYLSLIKFYDELYHNNSKFNLNYIETAFQCFVKTYPQLSVEFLTKFRQWLKASTLPDEIKTILKDSLKIIKIDSQLTPYDLADYHDTTLTILDENWKPALWNSPQTKEVIRFRLSNEGFQNLIENNIRPDLNLFKTTFRKVNIPNQQILIEFMKHCRLYTKINKFEFDIYIMQVNNWKRDDIRSHYLLDQQLFLELTNNQKLLLSRILFNNKLNYQSIELLTSIQTSELNNQSKQFQFNFLVRNYIDLNQFQPIIDLIDQFPIDKVVLNQYFLNQCKFIEKKMRQKVKHYNAKVVERRETDCKQLRRDSKLAFTKLRGLIGDISLRLNQDNNDLIVVMDNTFKLFDEWIKRDL
ncbi:hypothetical protein DFJ63DRAFT_314336 [Scheffersomyces coipomensis]|uniref:uncharacterized protein n=1 Tax=Scheffersomyces coipomensis TaxID=1788519 RepID=UPI00315D76C6